MFSSFDENAVELIKTEQPGYYCGLLSLQTGTQEIETALRLNIPLVVLIWNDGAYGLIEWKQMTTYGRPSHVHFNNPDFVKYAESFGAKGYRVEHASQLMPILREALNNDGVNIIDCPVDYTENLKLTAKLGEAIFQL